MKKLLYILFHRSVFVGLALVAQLATLFIMVSTFSTYTESFYWCCIALSVTAAIAIVGSRMEPGYKIAWLLLILYHGRRRFYPQTHPKEDERYVGQVLFFPKGGL